MKASLLLLVALLLPMPLPLRAVDHVLILGDSLSKEYSIEGPGIGISGLPDPYPESWPEILERRRSNYFSMGSSGVFSDWRIAGHEYNWSIPGSFAAEWRDDYLPNAPGELEAQIENGEVQRCVIWLGGNDVRDSYGRLYNGQVAPAAWAADVYSDIAWTLDWVLARRQPDLEIVLVNVAHLGATPKKNADAPYDPVKTGRVTAALDDLNSRLSTLAAQRGVGLADIYSMTKELVTRSTWCIGGWQIYKQSSSSGDSDAMFLGDGFHPNTPVQAIFAQRIVDAFNETYGPKVPRLPYREIVQFVLAEDPDFTLSQWTSNYGIPSGDRGFADDPDRDGVKNIVEFALDLDPTHADNALLPQPRVEMVGSVPHLAIRWQPRDPTNNTEAEIVAQYSTDLINWQSVPAGGLTSPPFNSRSARMPMTSGRLWLRLRAKQL